MFKYVALTVDKVSVVLRISICLVFKGLREFFPDNTCSLSDCLFSRISLHFLRKGIVFVNISGMYAYMYNTIVLGNSCTDV